jgi:RNA polymerase sigma factor (sigma-70 family)
VARDNFHAVLKRVTAAVRPMEGDAELLDRFTRDRDQAAFAELVRRYGRLVWAQCRNLLPTEADAEDALQATFLTLARSAGSVRDGSRLGPWLHGVAYRVCLNARRATARRKKRERAAAAAEAHRPVADSAWDAALAAVHEEVCRLPESLRVPFVLCCLEGKGVTEAATQLGWKLGTLSARLTRAKQTLIDRLASRGLPAAVAGAVAVTGGAASAEPPVLIAARAVELAFTVGPVSPTILSLAHGVTGMTLYRTKLFAAAVLLAGGLTAGVGSGWLATAAAQQADKPGVTTPPAAGERADNQPRDLLLILEQELSRQAAEQLALTREKKPATKWEYDFVLANEMGTTKFVEFLRDREARGWEFNGEATLQHEGKAAPHWVFRRPAAQPVTISGGVLNLTGPGATEPRVADADLILPEVRLDPPAQPNAEANRVKELEDQIKKLQAELARLRAPAAVVQKAFRPEELPLGASELADILRRLALKKYGYERLKFVVDTPANLLSVAGDQEAVDWAVGIVQKLSGK